MFPVVVLGRRTCYQKALASISAAPFKNCVLVSKQFLFIIATALLPVVFQASEAAAAWHRAV